MAEKRRKFEPEFREGALRIVAETGRPVAEVAKDLGINETTLASWISRSKRTGAALQGQADSAVRSARSWSGCGGRMRTRPSASGSWRWSVMCSNAAWSCG
ncbi:transposase [Streptomyces sp. XD-27]|uniref:transposase n=1 Tax=Streptomyces sp. XD-27 TaxID=3062779 RepID=UPI0026F47398|nr:transposase [Streptomyces sp. XD-27]WKX68591.1 transposase [Streptomyces sp. XD-27]